VTERPEQAAIGGALAGVTAAQWAALWEAVDSVSVESEHATWHGGEVVRTMVVDGEEKPVWQMPYPVYSDTVNRLTGALADAGLVVSFDWMAWDGLLRYEGGRGLSTAPVADAVRVVTATIRGERFCDGNIEAALHDGLLPAALDRLRRWFDEERPPT
jgi:hypothetical protein